MASESEPGQFDSGGLGHEAVGHEPAELAEPADPPPPPQQPAAPSVQRHLKPWRWVRTPSPVAVIARALDPRSTVPTGSAGRRVDPVRVLAREADTAPAPRARSPTAGAGGPPSGMESEAAAVVAEAAHVETQGAGGAADTEAAFWQIWLEHRDYLRQHSLRLSSGNAADAEDALSEAMLRAAQAFSRSAIRNHRAWLLRLVHNACMDRYRSNHRHKQLAQVITEEAVQSVPAIAVQRDRTPEDLLAALEQIYDLQRAMSSLPPMLAEPLLLYLNDVTDGEIAGNLRVTKEVVRKRRQIARAWLRRHTST